MTTFTFTATGSYSETFGWDTGLACTLGQTAETSDASADLWQNAARPTYNQFQSGFSGVYHCHINQHGGSRSLRGYVVAESEDHARELLDEFAQSF